MVMILQKVLQQVFVSHQATHQATLFTELVLLIIGDHMRLIEGMLIHTARIQDRIFIMDIMYEDIIVRY